MEITIRTEGRVSLVSVTGSIDTGTSSSLTDKLTGLIEEGHYQIILDLSGVDYTSSAGLRVLLGAAKRTRENGGDLRLSGVQPNVFKVLSLSGFTSILKIFNNTPEAIGSFG